MNNTLLVTQASVTTPYNDFATIDLSLITDNLALIAPWLNTVGQPLTTMALVQHEFKCLWCGTPNPMTDRFCGQCGGPRGMLIQDAAAHGNP